MGTGAGNLASVFVVGGAGHHCLTSGVPSTSHSTQEVSISELRDLT